jgi:hypothetical protein
LLASAAARLRKREVLSIRTAVGVAFFGLFDSERRTAGYHEVCAAGEDGYDVCGGGEDWEQRGVLPERVY